MLSLFILIALRNTEVYEIEFFYFLWVIDAVAYENIVWFKVAVDEPLVVELL